MQQQGDLSNFNEVIELFNNLVERILGNKDIHTTTNAILKNLRKMLGCFGGGIYLVNDEKTELKLYGYTDTKLITSLTKVIPGNIFRFSFLVSDENLLISKCFRENKSFTSTKLRDFFSPLVSISFMNTLEFIGRLKFYVAIPIHCKSGVIGVMFAVFRKAVVTDQDLLLLQFYANMSGMAMESNMQFQELEQKYEMERETTSMLSHELKTPIAVAHNSAQSVLMSLDKYKSRMDDVVYGDLSKMANDIQKSMERLNRVCNSIFSLREVEMRVPTDVNALDLEKQLEGILEIFENRARKKGLVFKHSLISVNSKVFAPIVQVEQVISILLDNALKYTEHGEICLTAEVKGDKLFVVVTDTGRGIPKSKREMIFGRFYRYTDWSNSYFKKTEGLGLGLYIAKKILNQIKGGITVTNNGKKGSKFSFEVPVYKNKSKIIF